MTKMKTATQQLFRGLIALMLTACFIGCSPEPTDSASDSTPSSADESEGQAAADERISLSAEEFAAIFKEDVDAANERFLNKQLALTGTVQSVGAFSYPGGYIYLGGIKWETEDKQPWARALPGQTVTIEGTFEPGVMMKIAKVSDDRLVASAPELAAELQANGEATNAKYLDKWLEVQGKVSRLEVKEAEPVCVYLEGAGDVLVKCRWNYEKNAQGEKLMPGDDVRIVGHYTKPDKEGEILITSCLGIGE
jgi:hypothetical protein